MVEFPHTDAAFNILYFSLTFLNLRIAVMIFTPMTYTNPNHHPDPHPLSHPHSQSHHSEIVPGGTHTTVLSLAGIVRYTYILAPDDLSTGVGLNGRSTEMSELCASIGGGN